MCQAVEQAKQWKFLNKTIFGDEKKIMAIWKFCNRFFGPFEDGKLGHRLVNRQKKSSGLYNF
jgi:hypothetical protein